MKHNLRLTLFLLGMLLKVICIIAVWVLGIVYINSEITSLVGTIAVGTIFTIIYWGVLFVIGGILL